MTSMTLWFEMPALFRDLMMVCLCLVCSANAFCEYSGVQMCVPCVIALARAIHKPGNWRNKKFCSVFQMNFQITQKFDLFPEDVIGSIDAIP